MAKANPLQEQLLKAGLVKKSKVAEVAREQNKARHAKAPAGPSEIQIEAERARAEKVERDRALAAESKAQARIAELRAQARQIIQDRKVPRSGESEYRFSVDGAIRAAAAAKPVTDAPTLIKFVAFDPAKKMSEASATDARGDPQRVVKGAYAIVIGLARRRRPRPLPQKNLRIRASGCWRWPPDPLRA